ncbi:tetratricopeptide repeat protein [Streptomyces profundus]|uniref:tetratricopeptide repeat protein n=1 Tax=Streptomyces profundus TaxID=2867410 RepID=UPI001D16D39B|nr:tetratricopeptide repeat protein [Streptomyces sp. MA3_2.13]UED83837.1 tetratricopeptide repeat protein [Streptomyces sp. MA3_2.13]
MNGPNRDERLVEAIRVRAAGQHQLAREQLVALAGEFPDDVEVAFHTAWAHDLLGLEAAAVPFYERALSQEGLSPEDRQGALLGLGSTYRVLGRYESAVATLRRGVDEFPDHAGLRTFLAMALYNTGEHRESTGLLLHLLATTSQDPTITDYRQALDRYADHLDETTD